MSRYSGILSLVVSIILISLAISASNDILNDATRKENAAVVSVPSPKDETSPQQSSEAEVLTDNTQHYHESGLSAAMVDALKKIEDSTRSATGHVAAGQVDDTAGTQTIDFSVKFDISIDCICICIFTRVMVDIDDGSYRYVVSI